MTPFLVLVGVSVVLAVVLPPRFLLSAAVLAVVAVPLAYLNLGSVPIYAAPGVVLVVAWMLRAASTYRPSGLTLGLVGFIVFWFAISALLSSDPARTWPWLVVFTMSVVLPFAKPSSVGAREALTTWLVVAVALSLVAVVEVWVVQGNVLSGLFAGSRDNPLVQRWSVYRAFTILGHPLLNSAFFSVGFGVAIGRILGEGVTPLRALSVVLTAAGVLATGSRSGLLALAVALVVALLASWFRGQRAKNRSLGTFGILFILVPVAGLASVYFIAARSDSWEAGDSVVGRSRMFEAALTALSDGSMFGSGPNALGAVAARYLGVVGGNFENSWLELAISVGPVGAIAVAVALLTALVRGVRGGNIAGPTALAAYAASAGSFNLIFGYPFDLPLLGILLVCAASPAALARADGGTAEDTVSTGSLGRRSKRLFGVKGVGGV